MHYITEIGLTSRFFQVYHSYHTVYHENSGTLPLRSLTRFVTLFSDGSIYRYRIDIAIFDFDILISISRYGGLDISIFRED